MSATEKMIFPRYPQDQSREQSLNVPGKQHGDGHNSPVPLFAGEFGTDLGLPWDYPGTALGLLWV